MNFVIPTTATFPAFDGFDAGRVCFADEGWTRLIVTDSDPNYFQEISNNENSIKVRGINNVPNGTYNQAITFLALQPQASQRQITIQANGIIETINAGFDRLRMWETNYTEERGWYWRETLRFPSITQINNNTGETYTLENFPFESIEWQLDDNGNLPYNYLDDQGATITSTPLVVTFDPRPCPKLFCFTFSTGDTLNNANGSIFIELEITLDN